MPTTDDFLTALSLIFMSVFGIGIYVVEFIAMVKLSSKYNGFTFILCLSVVDILLLFQFGIWPGFVILTKNTIFPIGWKIYVHVYMDTTWFSMCYMQVIVGISRFACVSYPIEFRRLKRLKIISICSLTYILAFIQSITMHIFSWFEPLYFDPDTYGLTGNFRKYSENGTQIYYLTINSVVMCSYLMIYFATAWVMTCKRRTLEKLQLHFHKIPWLRKIQKYDPDLARSQNAELKLMVPCVTSAIIFVVGQILINNIFGENKWTGYATMFAFSLQSVSNPILRLIFSTIIRQEIFSKNKPSLNKTSIAVIAQFKVEGTNPWTKIVALAKMQEKRSKYNQPMGLMEKRRNFKRPAITVIKLPREKIKPEVIEMRDL